MLILHQLAEDAGMNNDGTTDGNTRNGHDTFFELQRNTLVEGLPLQGRCKMHWN